MANSEWRIEGRVERREDKLLSGFAGMAGSHGASRVRLYPHAGFSARRAFRPDVANAAFIRVGPCKHCGRSRSRAHEKLYPIASNCTGIVEGDGDSFASCGAGWRDGGFGNRSCDAPLRVGGKNAASAYPLPSAATLDTLGAAEPRHSPFAIRHSFLAHA